MRSGGSLELGGSRYRLRTRLLGGWQLRDEARSELARLDSRGGAAHEVRITLGPAAPHEPRLATLLLASCQAMIWDAMTPQVGAGDGG